MFFTIAVSGRTRSHPGARIRGVLTAALVLVPSACAQAQGERTLGPLDAQRRVGYFIAAGEPGSGYRDSDRELARWALEAWERTGNGAFHFVDGPEATALVRVYWVPAGGGEYGEMRRLLVDGRLGAAVFIRPDTDALGDEIGMRARADDLFRDTIVYLTCVHELGHALGLQHTAEFDDVMYFFGYGGDIPRFFGRYRHRLHARADIAGEAGVSGGDLAQLHTLYGK
jgi:Matrixin